MTTGSRPARSSKHAAPESANQANSSRTGLPPIKKLIGKAIHKLRHLKQSIRFPAGPVPNRRLTFAIRLAGPSSLDSKCVIRQVARAARANLIQKLVSIILLTKCEGRLDDSHGLHVPRSASNAQDMSFITLIA